MSYISSQTDYCKIVLFYACLFNLERENIISNFGDINFWFSTARRFGKANEWRDFLDRPVILDWWLNTDNITWTSQSAGTPTSSCTLWSNIEKGIHILLDWHFSTRAVFRSVNLKIQIFLCFTPDFVVIMLRREIKLSSVLPFFYFF